MSEKDPSLEQLAKKEGTTPPGTPSDTHEVLRFISHSQLFYYWPVWITSLIFAVITRFQGKEFVVNEQKVYFVTSPGLGLAFLIILLAVVLFTSVNVRGLWAALVAAAMVILGLLFHFFGVWAPILSFLGGLSFYMSYHFYLTTGLVLGGFWLVVFFVFDQRHYIEFRPTQITIVEEVGDGARNYDTTGLVFDKKRDNFFQHLILGFGSGDLKITTGGAQREEVYFPNVLNINHRIEQIKRIREQRGR